MGHQVVARFARLMPDWLLHFFAQCVWAAICGYAIELTRDSTVGLLSLGFLWLCGFAWLSGRIGGTAADAERFMNLATALVVLAALAAGLGTLIGWYEAS